MPRWSSRMLHSLPSFTYTVRSADALNILSLLVRLSYQPGSASAFRIVADTSGLIFIHYTIFAESNVRVRIRRRIVTIHRQRRENVIVSVITAKKTTNHQCSCLISTSPIADTPILTCWLTVGMDF